MSNVSLNVRCFVCDEELDLNKDNYKILEKKYRHNKETFSSKDVVCLDCFAKIMQLEYIKDNNETDRDYILKIKDLVNKQ